MDNLAPVNPDELPDGYSVADPNAAAGGNNQQKSSEGQQKEQQKQAVLEQALTTDALARLRRIKVGPYKRRSVSKQG
jgi:programmed cell death protein 5